MTVNLAAKRCSVSDIISLIFYPEELFTHERPHSVKQIMEENASLHLQYGLDNSKMVILNYRGWMIEGIPDQIFEDEVVEGKVVRISSNVDKLMAIAWFQAGIYALALEKPRFRIVLFRNNDLSEYYSQEFTTKAEEPRIKMLLDYALEILNAIRSLGRVGDQYARGAWRDGSLIQA